MGQFLSSAHSMAAKAAYNKSTQPTAYGGG